MNELPSGWALATIGEVASIHRGVTYKKKDVATQPASGLLPILRATNISEQLSFDECVYVPEELIKRDQLLREGDIVMAASSGSARVVGKSAQLLRPWRGSFGAFCACIRPAPEVSPRYLAWFLASDDFRRRASRLAAGSNINNLKRDHISETPFPLPPRDEQNRIVAAIGAAMTGIDDAVASFKEAERLLDAHRSAILETECLGRSLNHDRVPSESGLPAIPETWQWRSVAELAASEDRAITDGPFGSNLKTAHYTNSGPRVIRLQNIGLGEFVDAEAHISQEHFERLRTHEARAGDVVVASLGDTLPRACVVPGHLGPAIVKADCPRIRVGDAIRPEFLCAALNSPPVRRQAASLIAGIGRPRLNLGKLKRLRIPTPSLPEQDQILYRIQIHAEARTRTVEALSAAYEVVETLRRSILRRAFTGRLVRPDHDLPAPDVLDNIAVRL